MAETSPPSVDANPDELLRRFDVQAADRTYGNGLPVDWPRRIVGGVRFLCDADEEAMKGGDVALHRDRAFANDRVRHDPEETVVLRRRHDTGVLFLDCNAGFRGPTPMTAITGPRKWIGFSISSRRDVWPFARTDRGATGHFETKPAPRTSPAADA